ncbi:MAG: phage terminase large subunit family protein [Xanthomonadaceae bacterium]|nr:phage terminase large subunit family protein [Xanthomonadaceae bacterium]
MSEPLRAASARTLFAAALEAAIPAPPLDVAAWAAANRWTTGPRGGRWSHELTPYLVEPMKATTNRLHTTVALVGPGQCGKTGVGENLLLGSIDADPASFLWYMQTDETMRAYVKERIEPLIEAHRGVAAKQGLRPVDDSIGFKRFKGMTAQFLGASRANLVNKTAKRIVADEWDAYPTDFGDPKAQLDIRRQAYGLSSMLLAMSHPDLARGPARSEWVRGIMALYAQSDRRTWWWRCPECSGVSSPNPGTARHMELVFPQDGSLDDAEREAALLCPCCGAHIGDEHRRAMNTEGFWAGAGQTVHEDGTISGELPRRDIAGFWIVGVMSPFLLRGIGGLARALEEARRAYEAEGDDKTLREVTVKQLGIPYGRARKIGSVDAAVLGERMEDGLRLGRVPEGVRFLTTFIDVQSNRFELMTRGFGVGAESWIVDRRTIPAAPALSGADWQAMIAAAVQVAYPLDDGSGRVMKVRAVGIDSAGEAGVTELAYAAWRQAKRMQLARRLGVVGGRDVWTLILSKGASNNAKRLVVSYPDAARADRRAAARGEVPVLLFAPDTWKDAIAAQLGVAEEGAGRVHFPAGLRAADEKGAGEFFEQLCAEQRAKSGRWEKTRPRNEALDLMVGTQILAHLHGLGRLDWARPPSWAAPWERNQLVEGAQSPPISAGRPAAAATPETPPPAAPSRSERLSRLA